MENIINLINKIERLDDKLLNFNNLISDKEKQKRTIGIQKMKEIINFFEIHDLYDRVTGKKIEKGINKVNSMWSNDGFSLEFDIKESVYYRRIYLFDMNYAEDLVLELLDSGAGSELKIKKFVEEILGDDRLQWKKKKRKGIYHKDEKFHEVLEHIIDDKSLIIPPVDNKQLLYLILGNETKIIKIGRTINWGSRKSLYRGGSVKATDVNYFNNSETLRVMSYEYINGDIEKLYAGEKLLKENFGYIAENTGLIDKKELGYEWFQLCENEYIDEVLNKFKYTTNKYIKVSDSIKDGTSKSEIIDKLLKD